MWNVAGQDRTGACRNGPALIADMQLVGALENVKNLVLAWVDVTRWAPTGSRNLLEHCKSSSSTGEDASWASDIEFGRNRRLSMGRTYANIRNCEFRRFRYFGRMRAFVYRCPATGFNVQGFAGDDRQPVAAPSDNVYEAVTCTACRRVHLVNPATGHVAGANAKPGRWRNETSELCQLPGIVHRGYRPDHFRRDGGRDWHWRCFSKGRGFAAWLGLIPKQISTGDRTILGKISKSLKKCLILLVPGERIELPTNGLT
jgi:hypothetical protein